MESVIEYLSRTHEELRFNLDITPQGLCGYYAAGVAKCAEKEGKRPYIMEVSEIELAGLKDDGLGKYHIWFEDPKHIFPNLYESKFSFPRHFVCCIAEEAFDPLLGEPCLIGEYTQNTFKENLRMSLHALFGSRTYLRFMDIFETVDPFVLNRLYENKLNP